MHAYSSPRISEFGNFSKLLCLLNLHESTNFSLHPSPDNACVNNDEGVIKVLTLYLQEVQKDL